MAKLYDLRQWRNRLQPQQLAREPLCRFCKARGLVVAASIADHIVPHRGDRQAFLTGELQSLCATCHSAVKQAQEHGGGIRGCALDGTPIDPSHPWRQEAAYGSN